MKRYSGVTRHKEYLIIIFIIMFSLLSFAAIYLLRTYLQNNAIFQLEQLSLNYSDIVKEKISYYENIPVENKFLINQFLKHNKYEQITETLLTKSPYMVFCELSVIDTNENVTQYRSLYSDEEEILTMHNKMISFDAIGKSKIVDASDDFLWLEEQTTNHKLLILYYPLYIDSIFKGVLRLCFNSKELSNYLCNNKLFKEGWFFIADEEGNFLDKNDYNYSTINEYIQNTDYNNGDNRFNPFNSGHFFVDHNNKLSILQYFPINSFNWQLGILCPLLDIYSDAGYFYIIAIILVLLFFGISFLLIHKQVNHSYKPLIDLVNNIEGISEGRIDVPSIPKNAGGEIEILYTTFTQMQSQLDAYVKKITDNVKQQQHIDTEIKVAQRVQTQFLNHQPINNEHIKISSLLKQSRKVGGDLYDYFITKNKLLFAIGDVSGKGMPAAIYMGSFLKLFHYVAYTSETTEDIFNILNEQMCADENNDMYITLFMGVIDLETGLLSYCNAGHPFPVFITEKGDVLNINNEPDVPIGIIDGYEFNCYSLQLKDKDKFILYTDGITDAEDKHANFYGKESLYECIEKNRFDDPDQLINHILNEIQIHIIDTKQSDDLTLMAIQYFS